MKKGTFSYLCALMIDRQPPLNECTLQVPYKNSSSFGHLVREIDTLACDLKRLSSINWSSKGGQIKKLSVDTHFILQLQSLKLQICMQINRFVIYVLQIKYLLFSYLIFKSSEPKRISKKKIYIHIMVTFFCKEGYAKPSARCFKQKFILVEPVDYVNFFSLTNYYVHSIPTRSTETACTNMYKQNYMKGLKNSTFSFLVRISEKIQTQVFLA